MIDGKVYKWSIEEREKERIRMATYRKQKKQERVDVFTISESLFPPPSFMNLSRTLIQKQQEQARTKKQEQKEAEEKELEIRLAHKQLLKERTSEEWRAIKAEKAREWRTTPGGYASTRRYGLRSGRVSGQDISKIILSTLKILTEENQRRKAAFERAIKITEASQNKLENRYRSSFYQKIFQPCVCIDCGETFETLHPVEWVALDIKNDCGTKRCPVHRKARYNSNHGGDYRRCKKFGVPYDSNVNRIVVLDRDDWHCYRCGIETPKTKRGTYEPDAPEVDHVWALAEIRDGQKSPGHVYSNLRCICRKCNTEKNKEIIQRTRNTHDEFHKQRLNGWLKHNGGDVDTPIVCPQCGKSAIKKRVNAKYCSEACLQSASSRRETDKRGRKLIPNSNTCLYCGAEYKPFRYNQRFCCASHGEVFRKNGHKPKGSPRGWWQRKPNLTPVVPAPNPISF